jgi:HD superfamily phosphohydrolase
LNKLKISNFIIKTSLSLIVLFIAYGKANAVLKNTIQTIISTQNIESPIISELLSHPVMERIKNIDQSGPLYYFGYVPAYSRYDHCLGVWALLKHYNLPLKEQVAGLLHDTSHTIFSHVGDYIFNMPEGSSSYQDTIHLEYLKKQNILPLVEKYGLTLEDLDSKNRDYRALEQDLPNLCADRIEYILHTGVLYNKISKAEVKEIITSLNFRHGQWYFSSEKAALKFAELSLYLTESFWGAAWNLVFYHYFGEILRNSLEIGIITLDDIHFGNDKEVLQKLFNTNSDYIQNRLIWCRNIHRAFQIVESNNYDIILKAKFRGVDPLIKKPSGLFRLTELNSEYKMKFNNLKESCAKGYKIKLIK